MIEFPRGEAMFVKIGLQRGPGFFIVSGCVFQPAIDQFYRGATVRMLYQFDAHLRSVRQVRRIVE
jgi:hypothetical protein